MNKILFGLVLVISIYVPRAEAVIPCIDPLGVAQNAAETGQIAAGGATLVNTLATKSKVLAKLGSAVKSVSGFIEDAKKYLEEQRKKMQEYANKAKDYAAKAQAYKAQAQNIVSETKASINNAKETIENIATETQNTINQTKTAINNVGNTLDNIASGNNVVDNISNLQNNIKDVTTKAVSAGTNLNDIKQDTIIELNNTKESLDQSGKTLKKDIKELTPSRKAFTLSFSYNTSAKLAFASLSSSVKTGTTEENILIVPETLSLRCELNYEQAMEKDLYDECLREVNNSIYSEQDDINTKDAIYEAETTMQNGYLEMLAAGFFESMNIYNESLNFKNDIADHITTSSSEDIDTSWRIAKEAHQILGDRLNILNQIWGRSLAVDSYGQYAKRSIVVISQE